ncbi:hypothetical protein [Humisphaera borealis]|uniref:Lipoprotein n=1 Tax=Humisphaera borealis TaxID=2807512 RepID=A0A7M2WQW2_9BACT|nr:hypothetical protein [Humisphaera borealis]QOV87799.1 hypothetical protein IPV69_16085 [Humisphaera borealis]
MRPYRLIATVLFLLLLATGCATPSPQPTATPPATLPSTRPQALTDPRYVEVVRATCTPPADWSAEPIKTTSISEHQVWISPSGATAYGVLNVRHLLMPLASNERILGEFLDGMLKSEGAADLLEKQSDNSLADGRGGIRFVARGGKYTVRACLTSSGRNAWIWYAGTLSGQPVIASELATAESAREQTSVGVVTAK